MLFNEPIKTIQQGKSYFMAMGCSHFHMSREYPERYEEYLKLSISKEDEKSWMGEQVDTFHHNILTDVKGVPLWSLHSQMADLVETLKTRESLIRLLNATEAMVKKIPLDEKVVVAETINGRRPRDTRSGLIYSAYDLGLVAEAKRFSILSLEFSSISDPTLQNVERCQAATKLCQAIIDELGI